MATYWVKTFGADKSTLCFHRLPSVVIEAQKAFSAHDVVGFLICALVRPPRLTGLLFGDQTRDLPDGLPIRTPAMTAICEERGFTVIKVEGGDVYVVAHWLHENGEIDRFDRVH